MSRQGLIVSGAVIAGIGLLVTVVSYSAAQHGGSHIIAYGAIGVGLFRMIRGFATHDGPGYGGGGRDVDPAPIDDKPTPLIGGAKCAQCGEKIVSRLDGTACRACNQPLHHDCRDAHRAEAHGKDAARPGAA